MSDDAEADRFAVLEGALALHKRLLKEEVQRNEALEEELDDLKSRPVVASSEHADLKNKHAAISEQCVALAAELRAVKEEHAALQTKHTGVLETALLSGSHDVASTVATLQGELKNLKEGKDLAALVAAMQPELAVTRVENQSHIKTISDHVATITQLRAEIGGLTQERDGLKQHCVALAVVTLSAEEVAGLRAQVKELKERSTALSAPATDAVVVMSDLRTAVASRDCEIARLKAKVLSVNDMLIKKKTNEQMESLSVGLKKHAERAMIDFSMVDTMVKVISGEQDVASLMEAWRLHCENVVQRQQEAQTLEVTRILAQDDAKLREMVREYNHRLSMLSIEKDKAVEEITRLKKETPEKPHGLTTPEQWVCRHCTLINRNDALTCDVCMKPKYNL